MSLFGGRQAKSTSNKFGWGRRDTSSARQQQEREMLIGRDEFDDSDAISLLSNIADRDARRGGSAGARRRARARARAKAQGRMCGTFWFDLEDWGRAMSCGLLGRDGENEDIAEARRQRAASIGSVMSRGARRNHTESSTAPSVATSRHSRSLSDTSTDSAGSLAGSGFAEVDADAGMLDDGEIARFGQPTTSAADTEAKAQAQAASAAAESNTQAQAQAQAQAHADADAEAEAETLARARARTQEAQRQAAAERQQALEAEAARLSIEAEAEAQRQKDEEARLAAEEEAAIAKARRKAQRKAAKAGLLQLQQETKAAQRWRTEAEAEAAAGGFAFTDADRDEVEYGAYAQHHSDYADFRGEQEVQSAEYDQYGDVEQVDRYYAATVEERGAGGVVHHHHYYHTTPPVAEEDEFHYPLPSSTYNDAETVKHESESSATAAVADQVSEDEADIAGLSFGRKKTRRDQGGSAGSRSGSGLRPAYTAGGSSSGGSGSGLRAAPTSASSSSGSRAAYRDRPRRHERTNSTSSSGLLSHHSSNPLHARTAPSTAATSIASPSILPNLYESQSIYVREPDAHNIAHPHLADPDVDTNEFGVIAATTHKAGAVRLKKSYRNKRQLQPAQQPTQTDNEQFQGFPGF